MVNPFDPQAEAELPSVTAILDQFKAEQAALDRIPEPTATKINGSSSDGYVTINPGILDRLAEIATWADILQPAGWTQVRPPDTATLEAWKRPGGTHPVSAKVLKANPHVIVVHSEDAGLPSGAGQRLTKGRLYAHLYYGGNESAAAKALNSGQAVGLPTVVVATLAPPGAPNGADVTNVPSDATADDLEAIKAKFPRLDWHELWADQTEQEYIHNPLLPARRLIAIYSAPKIGKSLLMLEMAVTLSRCETFLGHTPNRRCRVLYVDLENDPRGDIRTRLQDMEYGPDDLDHLDYLSFPTIAALNTARGAAELIAAVKAYGSHVVVIDTVSRVIDGEENSNDTWLEFYLHTGLKLKQLGVAMIRLDHSGKDESKGMRGGSAKNGDVDAVWQLIRITDTKLRLECTANRMQLDTKQLKITRHTEPRLRHELEGADAITAFEAKILELIKRCDNDGLPADANRDAVRETAKQHGLKVGTQLIGEVVKRRKVTGNAPVRDSENTAENTDQTAPVNSGQPEESGLS